jgi:hypothetical protein
MGMVGTCLFLQLLVVVAQTRKAPKAKMAKEMLIVLSGLKPGFDAYEVAKGAEQSADSMIDPSTEHTCTKIAEMVAESIPGEYFPRLVMHLEATQIGLLFVPQVASFSSTCS